MDKYRNKYRRQSTRLPYWYYSANALYFLTMVTQNRECILGEVVNGEVILSEMGQIVDQEFQKSFKIRDELFLHEYIIMPNHLHMIVEIRKPNLDFPVASYGRTAQLENDGNDTGSLVETHGRASQPENQPDIERPFVRLPKSISSFIAGFKSAVNTQIDNYIDEKNLPIPKYNRKNHFFQSNYHDRIIRNKAEYFRIKNYIIQNPKNWNKDDLK